MSSEEAKKQNKLILLAAGGAAAYYYYANYLAAEKPLAPGEYQRRRLEANTKKWLESPEYAEQQMIRHTAVDPKKYPGVAQKTQAAFDDQVTPLANPSAEVDPHYAPGADHNYAWLKEDKRRNPERYAHGGPM